MLTLSMYVMSVRLMFERTLYFVLPVLTLYTSVDVYFRWHFIVNTPQTFASHFGMAPNFSQTNTCVSGLFVFVATLEE